jgi:hypothetical protein
MPPRPGAHVTNGEQDMAYPAVAQAPSDDLRSVLVPQIVVLRMHYAALGEACVQSHLRHARIMHEAAAVRAQSRSVRGETARGRAARDLGHRTGRPEAETGLFAWQLAELIGHGGGPRTGAGR